MEYTITLPDCPSAISYGADGSFLNPFGELGSGLPVVPHCLTGLPPCRHPQGTEDKPSACPRRQTCDHVLSE